MFKLKTVLKLMTLRYFHKKHSFCGHIHMCHTSYMTYIPGVLHKNKQKWMRVQHVVSKSVYRKI